MTDCAYNEEINGLRVTLRQSGSFIGIGIDGQRDYHAHIESAKTRLFKVGSTSFRLGALRDALKIASERNAESTPETLPQKAEPEAPDPTPVQAVKSFLRQKAKRR